MYRVDYVGILGDPRTLPPLDWAKERMYEGSVSPHAVVTLKLSSSRPVPVVEHHQGEDVAQPAPLKAASKSVPAYAVLAGHLRTRILSGELQPGERLPGEAELTAEFGVGRSTIREALRSLASQNLIETTRGVTGGSFVAVPSVGHISEHLETGVALMAAAEAVTVDQLMEVRSLMEVPAAGIAAFRRTDEHLEQLNASIFDPNDVQGPETFTKNQEFHLVLLRAAHNPLLELITAPVFRVLSGRFGRDHAPDGFWQCVDSDHRGLLDVVAAGDSMAAMDLMRKHLDHLGDSYRQMDRLRNP